jgi:hypothetical protein
MSPNKVYVVVMERQVPPFTGNYFLGVFSTEEFAITAARYETEHMRGKYTGRIVETKVDSLAETRLDVTTLQRLLTKGKGA